MGDTWVTDMTHFLDDTGQIGEMPAPARNLAEAVLKLGSGEIVWRCPACDDNGLISGWARTPWDRARPRSRSRRGERQPGAGPARATRYRHGGRE